MNILRKLHPSQACSVQICSVGRIHEESLLMGVDKEGPLVPVK